MTKNFDQVFLREVAAHLGVDPDQIKIKAIDDNGSMTFEGPMPKKYDVPAEFDDLGLCINFVHNISPPKAICDLWKIEYKSIKDAHKAAVKNEDWVQAQILAALLENIKTRLKTCKNPDMISHKYCKIPI